MPPREHGQHEHLEIARDDRVATADPMRPSADIAGLPRHHGDALREISIEGSPEIDRSAAFDGADRVGSAMKADGHDGIAEHREHAHALRDGRIAEAVDEIGYSQGGAANSTSGCRSDASSQRKSA